jgi:hypothetical protein
MFNLPSAMSNIHTNLFTHGGYGEVTIRLEGIMQVHLNHFFQNEFPIRRHLELINAKLGNPLEKWESPKPPPNADDKVSRWIDDKRL